ncbi:MAG: RsmE family RNA methyltransferase [candidate division WOR-3 bacterium]
MTLHTELFYAPPDRIESKTVRLNASESYHARRVQRHTIGDQLRVIAGRGHEYLCRIASSGKDGLVCSIISRAAHVREPTTALTLAVAMIRPGRMDSVVTMATELGVSEIIPLETERTQHHVGASRVKRWHSLALAALKSSTRTFLPHLRPPMAFGELMSACNDYDARLIAWEDEHQVHLTDILTTRLRRVVLVVGPEGGFTSAEIELARKRGFCPFTMGPRRLRTETACIAGIAMILSQIGEL